MWNNLAGTARRIDEINRRGLGQTHRYPGVSDTSRISSAWSSTPVAVTGADATQARRRDIETAVLQFQARGCPASVPGWTKDDDWVATHPSVILDTQHAPPLRQYGHTDQHIKLEIPAPRTPPKRYGTESVPSTQEPYTGARATSLPLPGEVPTCMVYDECYPDILDGPIIDRAEATARIPTQAPEPELRLTEVQIPGEQSWGVATLAFPESFSLKPRGQEGLALPDPRLEPLMRYTTRRRRKALAELPFGQERPTDFVEECAIRATAAEPTVEETLQNAAAMEIFFPGWSDVFTRPPTGPPRRAVPSIPSLIWEQLQPTPVTVPPARRTTPAILDDALRRVGERTARLPPFGWLPHEFRPRPVVPRHPVAAEPSVERAPGPPKPFPSLSRRLEQQLRPERRPSARFLTEHAEVFPRLSELRRERRLPRDDAGLRGRESGDPPASLGNSCHSRIQTAPLRDTQSSERTSAPLFVNLQMEHTSAYPSPKRRPATVSPSRSLTILPHRQLTTRDVRSLLEPGDRAEAARAPSLPRHRVMLGEEYDTLGARSGRRSAAIINALRRDAATAQYFDISGVASEEETQATAAARGGFGILGAPPTGYLTHPEAFTRPYPIAPGDATSLQAKGARPWRPAEEAEASRGHDVEEEGVRGIGPEPLGEKEGTVGFPPTAPWLLEFEPPYVEGEEEVEEDQRWRRRTEPAAIRYVEEDISAGYYWEKEPSAEAVSIVPLEVLRARRLRAVEEKKRRMEEHRQTLLQKRQQLRETAIALQKQQAELRQHRINHRRLAALLKSAVDGIRKTKANKLRSLIGTDDDGWHVNPSDCEYWSWEALRAEEEEKEKEEKEEEEIPEKKKKGGREETGSEEEPGSAHRRRHHAFRDTLDVKAIREELQRRKQNDHVTRIAAHQSTLNRSRQLEHGPRYLRTPANRQGTLSTRAAIVDWVRQNQVASPSGLLFFELRNGILLFSVPKWELVKHLRRPFLQRRYGRPAYLVPAPTRQLPRTAPPTSLTFVDGLVVHAATASVDILDGATPAASETTVLIIRRGSRISISETRPSEGTTGGGPRRRSLFGGRTVTFPRAVWRLPNEPYLVVKAPLFSNLPASGTEALQWRYIQPAPLLPAGILCVQGPAIRDTLRWYLFLRAAGAPARYVVSCTRPPSGAPVWPSREILYGLEDCGSLDAMVESDKRRSGEWYGAGAEWCGIHHDALIHAVRDVRTIQSICLSRAGLPGDFGIRSGQSVFEGLRGVLREEGESQIVKQRAPPRLVSTLDLSHNTFNAETLLSAHAPNALASFVAESKCRVLVLDNCNLTAEDLLRLRSLRAASRTLRTLSLRYNPLLDDASVASLATALREWPAEGCTLQYITFEGCTMVTEHTVAETLLPAIHRRFILFQAVLVSSRVPAENEIGAKPTALRLSQLNPSIYVLPSVVPALTAYSFATLLYPSSSEIDLSFTTFTGEEKRTNDLTTILTQLRYRASHAATRRLRLSFATGTLLLDPDAAQIPVPPLPHPLPSGPTPSSPLTSPPTQRRRSTVSYSILHSLYMNGCTFPFDDFENVTAFATVIAGCETRILDISGCPRMRAAAPDCLAALLRLILTRSSVRVLYMNHCHITDAVVEAFSQQLAADDPSASSHIEVLALQGNPMSLQAAGHLLTLLASRAPALMSIHLAGNAFPDMDALIDQLKPRGPPTLLEALDPSTVEGPSGAPYRELDALETAGPPTVGNADIEARIEELWKLSEQQSTERAVEREREQEEKVRMKRIQARRRRDAARKAKVRDLSGGRTELRYRRKERLGLRLQRLECMNDLVESATSGAPMPSFDEEAQQFVVDERLTTLNLAERDFKVSSVIDALHTALGQIPAVDAIVLSHMDMRNSEFMKLAQWLMAERPDGKRLTVQTVDVSFNQLGGTGRAASFDATALRLVQCVQLSKLVLDANDLGNWSRTAELLHRLITECPSLRVLSLRGTGIGDIVAEDLYGLIGDEQEPLSKREEAHWRRLRRIRLQHNTLSLEAIELLVLYLADTCPYILAVELGGTNSDLTRDYVDAYFRADARFTASPRRRRILDHLTYQPTFVRRETQQQPQKFSVKRQAKRSPLPGV